MGLGTYGGNATFAHISFKDGVIYVGPKASRKEYNFITGVPVGFKIKEDEYEGEAVFQAQLTLNDPKTNERYIVTFNAHSYKGGSIIGALNNWVENCVEGSEIRLNAWKFEKGTKMSNGTSAEKDITGVSVKCGRETLTPQFSDGSNKLPEANHVKIGKKEVLDMSAVIPVIEDTCAALEAYFSDAETDETGGTSVSDDDIPF